MEVAGQIIRPLIDPITYQKLSFDKDDPIRAAPSSQLDAHVGGTNGFEWVGRPAFLTSDGSVRELRGRPVPQDAKYWDTLIDECSRRRNERLKAWRDAGGEIGWSEWATATSARSDVDEGSSTAVATPDPAHSTPEPTKAEPAVAGATAAAPAAAAQTA